MPWIFLDSPHYTSKLTSRVSRFSECGNPAPHRPPYASMRHLTKDGPDWGFPRVSRPWGAAAPRWATLGLNFCHELVGLFISFPTPGILSKSELWWIRGVRFTRACPCSLRWNWTRFGPPLLGFMLDICIHVWNPDTLVSRPTFMAYSCFAFGPKWILVCLILFSTLDPLLVGFHVCPAKQVKHQNLWKSLV